MSDKRPFGSYALGPETPLTWRVWFSNEGKDAYVYAGAHTDTYTRDVAARALSKLAGLCVVVVDIPTNNIEGYTPGTYTYVYRDGALDGVMQPDGTVGGRVPAVLPKAPTSGRPNV